MKTRTSVVDAWSWVDQLNIPLRTEKLPIHQAAGRILATAVQSSVDAPGFRRAMMDGYAVRASEVVGASALAPVLLSVVGEQLPGQNRRCELSLQSAIKITTGAMMPPDADCVVPIEFVRELGQNVSIELAPPALKHVGQIGEDIRRLETVFESGRRLRPQDLGVLSSIGIGEIELQCQARVNIFATGNEILKEGSQPLEQKIPDANGPMLAALVERDGGFVQTRALVPDNIEAIRAAITNPADIVLMVGGSSAGHEDFVPDLIRELGSLDIHGIAMRPSSPAGMGRIDRAAVFVIPGNPVSALCAYDFFAGRLIRRICKNQIDWPYKKLSATLSRKIVSEVGRVDYARVQVRDGRVNPISIGGASMLSTTTRAEGFVIVDAQSEGFPAEQTLEVYLYD